MNADIAVRHRVVAGHDGWRYAPFVVGGVVFLVFLPAIRFEFLTRDDPGYVTENALVTGGITGHKLLAALTAVVVSN